MTRTFAGLCPPNLTQPYVLGDFQIELREGVVILYFSKNGLGPGTNLDSTWTREKPNLDQGRGSTWIKDGAQPGPVLGLNLDQARGSTRTRHGSQLGSGMGQPGADTGLNLDQARDPTWALSGPGIVF